MILVKTQWTCCITGYVRDLHLSSEGNQNLVQLGNWVTTLALHVLAAVPEFKTRFSSQVVQKIRLVFHIFFNFAYSSFLVVLKVY